MKLAALDLDPHAIRSDNREIATPGPVSARNNIAQTRQLIEACMRELELEIRMAQAEQHNLQLAWDATCEEWNNLWKRGML